MPFRSVAQQRWAFANPEKLGGIDKVMEWARTTNYGNLPKHVSDRKHRSVTAAQPPKRRKKP